MLATESEEDAKEEGWEEGKAGGRARERQGSTVTYWTLFKGGWRTPFAHHVAQDQHVQVFTTVFTTAHHVAQDQHVQV